MDLRTAMTIAALLLMTADVCLTQTNPTLLQTNGTLSPANSSTPCTCPTASEGTAAAPTPTSDLTPPVLGFLTIKWMNKCEGDVVLYHPIVTSPVCYESEKDLLENVCKTKRSCKGIPQWKEGRKAPNGSLITETGAKQRTDCNTLRVQCTVEVLPDVQGQLKTYKVMTALLCCVLVVILLIRFTRPTVKALQKRLSDRRQNRWIGPTQSHSVSYHRGKTVKTNDGEKRLSYPALERLTVSDSREPSSNRNSGYNF